MKRNCMTILFILCLAILAGAIVFWLTVRSDGLNEKKVEMSLVVNSEDFKMYNFEVPSVELTEDVIVVETQEETVVLTITETLKETTTVSTTTVLTDSNFVSTAIVETWPGYTETIKIPVEQISVPSGIIWGVYDFDGSHLSNPYLQMEQIYVNWLYLPGYTYSLAADVLNRGRIPLVSIEPYPWEGHEFDPLLISDGGYDSHITGHCSALNFTEQVVYVRWAHEMELSSEHGIFPWIGQTPLDMVEAFRHFTMLCREAAPNVQIVWSPAGHSNLNAYWPGSEYVDAIGLTALSNQLINGRETAEGAFKDLFGGRYNLVSDYGKPVFISEFGAAGSPEYVETYFREAYAQFRDYLLLKGVILFNLHQQDSAWGEGVHPDFRVIPETFPPR